MSSVNLRNTNALEIRDFGHRGKPAGESVVNRAWNPFDD